MHFIVNTGINKYNLYIPPKLPSDPSSAGFYAVTTPKIFSNSSTFNYTDNLNELSPLTINTLVVTDGAHYSEFRMGVNTVGLEVEFFINKK